MKTLLKKISLTLIILFVLMLSLTPRQAKAQNYLFYTPTYLQFLTNTPSVAAGNAILNIGTVPLIISGVTNGLTVITNNVCATINLGQQTNYLVVGTYVYNANGSTNGFTTNINVGTITVPCSAFFQAIPQAGGSNTCFIY